MTDVSSIERKENLETYFLIWLDVAVDNSEENIKAQRQLRTSINHLTTFNNDIECEEYIRSLSKTDRIVLIIGDQFGQKLVPCIHELQQISVIYIYCMGRKENQQWTQRFNKIKAVIVCLKDLIKKILSDQNQRQHNKIDEAFSISIFSTDASTNEGQSTSEINGQFIHSQLLIDCLTRMKFNTTDKDEFISICKQQYNGNDVELKVLKEFEEHYSPNNALRWYTKQSFLYRLLNKALRIQNIDLLFLFRFFIHDIEQQLNDNKCISFIRVYRGQLMSKDEIEILKNTIGQFVSVNSFLSTTIDRELAHAFIAGVEVVNHLERVFFEIDANPQLENIKPFSNITSYSHFPNEEEVLFMIGSIFQIDHIDRDSDNTWIIRMRLCSSNDHQLRPLLEHLKHKYNDEENSLISYGNILLKMGKFNEAEKYYFRCLEELSFDDKYIIRCYDALGAVAMRKAQLDSSLNWFHKSLQIKLQTLESNDSEIANEYNSIGKIYRKKGDLDKAIEMLEKALTIWIETLGENSLEVAKCYSDIGNVYQRKQMFSKALEYQRKVLNIREEKLPKYHSHLGSVHMHIATVYRNLGQYDRSLEHANLALEIFQKSLPCDHHKIGWFFADIGVTYEKQGKLEESLSYLKKAFDNQRQTLPITHYYITEIERNIQRVSSQLK